MVLTFRELTFDAAARRVSRDGREIRLTRKAFDLLALLVERRPDAISRDDIHARLWPDTFVAEITLHSLVSEIRRAIGDDANQPLFIRTVHGFGYAFIGESDDAPRAAAAIRRRVRDAATPTSLNCHRPPSRVATRESRSTTSPGSRIWEARTVHSSATARSRRARC
jgi:DNA-binding winged helix-turn-helix (wHTH) protein